MTEAKSTAGEQQHGEIERFWRHLFGGQRGLLHVFTGARDGATGEIPKGTITTRNFEYPGASERAAEWALEQSDEGREVYFCAHLLAAKPGAATRRVKANAAPVRALWGDLDGAEVPKEDGERKPTALVESSPGRYHPYWRLDEAIPPEVAEDLNRRLAASIGADPSGFDLTQLLRVPGTVNRKYPDAPTVALVGLEGGRSYSAAELDRLLPRSEAEERREALGREEDQTLAQEPPVRLSELQRRVWDGLVPKRKAGGDIDRSGSLLKIGRALYNAGANRPVIVAALEERDESLGWCKYAGRADAGQRYDEIADELERNGRRQGGGGFGPPSEADRRNPGQASPGHHGAAGFNLTDMGNAERLIARHGEDLAYAYPWGSWLVWNGVRWERDASGAVHRMAKATVRAIYHEAGEARDSNERKELARHATRSEAQARVDAMIALAKSEVPVQPEELDANPWALNVENGTLDLRSGELRPHRREDRITKVAGTRYDPDAAAPVFERFLGRVLPSEELRGFVQRMVGYALTGDVSEQVLPFLHGGGANGKSTLINAVMEALGDYAQQAAPEILTAKKGSHPTELADLQGARFVASVEVEDGRRLAEALVKQLTGGDRVKARFMRGDFFEFNPTHKVLLAANHKPPIEGTDRAIWRRIKLIPFDVTIPDAEKDERLPEKLRAELPRILAWAVRGCLAWQRDGLGEPDEVRRATQEYRQEMDVLAAFIEERCVIHKDATAPAAALWDAWKDWAETSNEEVGTQKRFGGRLGERELFTSFPYTSGPHKGRKGWRGIGLAAPDPDDERSTGVDDQPSTDGSNQAQPSSADGEEGLLGGPAVDDRLPDESLIDKPDSTHEREEVDDGRPNFDISSLKKPHVVAMPKHGLQRSTSSQSSTSSPAGPASIPPVETFFADPPSWFVDQAKRCAEAGCPDRLLKPLASTTAVEVLGDVRRREEVMLAVRVAVSALEEKGDGA